MTNTIRTVPRKWPGKSSIWGTLNLTEVEVLREFLNRFLAPCGDCKIKGTISDAPILASRPFPGGGHIVESRCDAVV